MLNLSSLSLALCLAAVATLVSGQDAASDALGVANGLTEFEAGKIKGSVVSDSQILASLESESGFDFLPSDFLANLSINGAHHLGDVTFRYKTAKDSSWSSADSATKRGKVVPLESLASGVIAGANLSNTLPSGAPLDVTREWLKSGDGLALRVNFTNKASSALELGALGLPVAINNIFQSRTAEETQAKCSLADPYIGLDAGYVRVSPVRGLGSALVVSPLGSSPFEAWRFLSEPSGDYWYQGQTYEGTYEWMIHSKAYAENEWKNTQPWNTPTSKTLEPGEMYSVGLKFTLASSIATIEDAVVSAGNPLAVGIPGYVVPSDLTARLYLTHSSPVKSIDSGGAFKIEQDKSSKGSPYLLSPSEGHWGRSKITVQYEDGKTQTIHYFVTKSAPSTVADLGNFLSTAAHFTNESDPFGRAPSIMTYDKEAGAIVEQDARVWISGLSDEGGTGAYVAAATKQFIQPSAKEVAVLDDFVHKTVVGNIQPPDTFAVRASIFYYQPDQVNYAYNPNNDWTSWVSFSKERAFTTRRAYNYVHPVVAYWALYRVARYYPKAETQSNWTWYLDQAYGTVQFCLSNRAAECDYGLTGLMGETVFAELLEDLKREGMTDKVKALEETMRYRAEHWESLAVPFGSEMAWDSTGQEGVYYWCNYFGLSATATKSINSIVAYMPTVAHWGWNGNARRYWDFNYGGKLGGTERQIHHYGSGLNSLPLLHYFEKNATDFNAIRVAHGGNTAPLSNIDEDGFPSAAFHSFPQHLKWDAYTGDYGLGFLGLGLGQTMYIVHDERYGQVVFGGNVVQSDDTKVVAQSRDAVRRRVFVADLGLKISLSAGAIHTVTYDEAGKTVELELRAAAVAGALEADSVVIWLSDETYGVRGASKSRGGYLVNLSDGQATVTVASVTSG